MATEAGPGPQRRMKSRDLEIRLQALKVPSEPRTGLEQYQTPARLAARLLFVAAGNGDIAGRSVLDPGCGNGIFAIGAAMLGARRVLGFDVDPAMVELARMNAAGPAAVGGDGWTADLRFRELSVAGASEELAGEGAGKGAGEGPGGGEREGLWDTVVMNPPFGAQRPARGADRPFLALAFMLADSVYSIHREGTESFVEEAAADAGFSLLWRERNAFRVPHTHAHHTRESLDVGVTLFFMCRRLCGGDTPERNSDSQYRRACRKGRFTGR